MAAAWSTEAVLKGNVAVYKGLFLELSSGHVLVITVYTFLACTSAVLSLSQANKS